MLAISPSTALWGVGAGTLVSCSPLRLRLTSPSSLSPLRLAAVQGTNQRYAAAEVVVAQICPRGAPPGQQVQAWAGRRSALRRVSGAMPSRFTEAAEPSQPSHLEKLASAPSLHPKQGTWRLARCMAVTVALRVAAFAFVGLLHLGLHATWCWMLLRFLEIVGGSVCIVLAGRGTMARQVWRAWEGVRDSMSIRTLHCNPISLVISMLMVGMVFLPLMAAVVVVSWVAGAFAIAAAASVALALLPISPGRAMFARDFTQVLLQLLGASMLIQEALARRRFARPRYTYRR